jgi:hypothetical protein
MSRSIDAPTSGSLAAKQPTGPRDRDALLAAAVSGILYFILGWVIPPDGPPVETASAAQIRVFLAEHHSMLRLGALVGAVAIPTVLVFTVSLARLIRSRLPWPSEFLAPSGPPGWRSRGSRWPCCGSAGSTAGLCGR